MGGYVYEDDEIIDRNEKEDDEDYEDDYYIDNDDMLSIIFMDKMDIKSAILA